MNWKIKTKILIGLLILGVVLVSGCVEKAEVEEGEAGVQEKEEIPVKDQAVLVCTQACQSQLTAGADLSAGPCLSNQIAPDWVCDVAHAPRQDIDNLPENQCGAWRTRTAHHFVEVSTACELIKAV